MLKTELTAVCVAAAVGGCGAEMDCANTTQTQTRLSSVDFSNLILELLR